MIWLYRFHRGTGLTRRQAFAFAAGDTALRWWMRLNVRIVNWLS